MDKEQLNITLARLHSELQQIEGVDENERQSLRTLMGDIERLVERDEPDQDSSYDRVTEGLKQGIKRFEASHPQATMLMGQLVDALANIGI